MLEDFFSEMDLCILNDGSLTYIHPATGSTSALDLSICGPSLVLDYEWNIHEDLCESDHFPVILTSNAVEEEAAPNRCNFKKADWLSFQVQCTSELTEEAAMSAGDPAGQFTDLLVQAANKTIPKTRFSEKLPKVPWFNDSCKRAIKDRKKAQRKFFSNPTLSNVQNFKLLRAKARHVVKQQKRNSWRHFCNKLNSKTQTRKVWKAIRKIKGKGGCNSVNHLKVNGNLITDKKEVAEVLAKNLSKNSSTDNYSDEFQRIKTLKEKRRLDFSSKNEEEYNLPFSVTELRQSLQRANDSATGLDQVHYQLLTHLPNSALSVLLKVYNHVWESGCFPPSWREAVVIPIPKPGMDHLDPINFRPIALTSCLCKTVERMINARLMWSLESQGLLSEKQCGFRKNHSTLDHLVRFETFIRNAFIKKEHVLTIFFDLEKAYDTTWKHGILADLWDLGFRGHLPRFIQSFLSERSFRVRVGSTLSELHEQEMGVPQGSILSPALFSIKINNSVKAVLKGTDCSLFVDDYALCVSGKTLNRVERAMQLCVNSVQKWVTENGFKFSTSKTVCIHFHQQYVFSPDPNILLGKNP